MCAWIFRFRLISIFHHYRSISYKPLILVCILSGTGSKENVTPDSRKRKKNNGPAIWVPPPQGCCHFCYTKDDNKRMGALKEIDGILAHHSCLVDFLFFGELLSSWWRYFIFVGTFSLSVTSLVSYLWYNWLRSTSISLNLSNQMGISINKFHSAAVFLWIVSSR